MPACTGAPPAQALPSGCGGNRNHVDWTRDHFVVSGSSTPQKYSCEGGIQSAPFAIYQILTTFSNTQLLPPLPSLSKCPHLSLRGKSRRFYQFSGPFPNYLLMYLCSALLPTVPLITNKKPYPLFKASFFHLGPPSPSVPLWGLATGHPLSPSLLPVRCPAPLSPLKCSCLLCASRILLQLPVLFSRCRHTSSRRDASSSSI